MLEPINKNYLQPHSFYLVFQRLPHVSYFCTSVGIPQISISKTSNLHSPFTEMPNPGDKISWAELTIKFKIDEDMENYLELYRWITGLGYPDNFNQRKPYAQRPDPLGKKEQVFSDGTLIITGSSVIPNIDVTFINLFPTSLGTVDFDVNQSTVTYLEATASFVYQKFELDHLNPKQSR
jgi:hypothetical protein